jgi:hypothetical protein
MSNLRGCFSAAEFGARVSVRLQDEPAIARTDLKGKKYSAPSNAGSLSKRRYHLHNP